MNDSIHHGVRQGRLTDEFVPVFDGDLRGDDEGPVGRQFLDQIVENELVGFLHGMQSEVVEDEQMKFGQVTELFEVGTIGFGAEELIKDFTGGGEPDFKSLQTGGVPQGGSQEGFADAGGAGDEDVFAPPDKMALGQLQDGGSVKPLADVGKIELLDGGALLKMSLSQQVLGAAIMALFPFGLDKVGDKLLGTELFHLTGLEGALVSVQHTMQAHLTQHVKVGLCSKHVR